MTEDTLKIEMEELRSVGILKTEKEDKWIVAHFKQRQSAEPTALRSRHYREFIQKDKFRHESVTKRDADVDIDGDEEEERDRDADEEKAVSSCSPSDELVKTFIEHTKIPPYTGGEEKWARALARIAPCAISA